MSDVEYPPNKSDALNLTTESGNIREAKSVLKNDGKCTGHEEQRDVLQDVNFTELNDNERILLYEKGVQKQSTRHALHCLLGCLQGLKDGARFPMLPDCLHHIADIYGAEGDYENAISFAQAEKLYYETALISVGTTTEHSQGGDQKSSMDPKVTRSGENNEESPGTAPAEVPEKEESKASENVKKADEYEKLSHLCLKQKNIQLALEYCGKAVKIRQSHFGENHPVTTKSLNLFTVIYAEMGKEQYSAAMKKFSEAQEQAKNGPKSAPDQESSSEEPKLGPHQNVPRAGSGKEGCSEEPKSGPHQNGPQPCSTKEGCSEEPRSDPQQNGAQTGSSEEAASDGPGSGRQQQDPDTRETQSKDEPAEDPRTGDGVDSQQRGQFRSVDRTVVWFFVFTVMLGVLTAVLLNHVSQRDLQAMYKYTVTRIKYFYYFYFRQAPKGDKFF